MLLGIPVQLIRILLTWVAFTGKPCININININIHINISISIDVNINIL